MKSNIPVIILSIKRNKSGANKTLNHLKKYFSNIKIFYGLDIKSPQNTEKIKSSDVVSYNIIQMIKKFNITKPFIFAEDDLRITRPEQLLNYLKGGIKGDNINRLVYASSKKEGIGGAIMVGINKPQNLLNKLENTRLGHFDKWMNKIIHTPGVVTNLTGAYDIAYYDEYIGGIDVTLADDNLTPRYTIRYFEAYPKTVSPLELAYGTNNTLLNLQITWNYTYWENLQTTNTYAQQGFESSGRQQEVYDFSTGAG